MKQRWALVLLGAWTMGSICMSLVATQNFYTVDRLLVSPSNAGLLTVTTIVSGTLVPPFMVPMIHVTVPLD